jgi:hypothetical protein
MKTRVCYLAGVFFFFCSFISCMDDEVIKVPKDEKITENGIIEMSADSLNIKYQMQSNSEIILADRLIHKNGAYVLDLAWEEASQLGISKDLYDEFNRKVNELNSDTENY